MDDRITDLEIRFSHQQAAVEEMTRTLLQQELELRRLGEEVERLKALLREMAPAAVAPREEEGPPPHY